jgi:serine/threonine-protein kinase SRPK3
MSEQLLKAIEFIHKAGMGHGGRLLVCFSYSFTQILSCCDCTHVATDISGSNIAFTCSHLSTATEEALFKVLGPQNSEPLVCFDGKPLDKNLPKHPVKAASWGNWAIDFEEGFLQGAGT